MLAPLELEKMEGNFKHFVQKKMRKTAAFKHGRKGKNINGWVATAIERPVRLNIALHLKFGEKQAKCSIGV